MFHLWCFHTSNAVPRMLPILPTGATPWRRYICGAATPWEVFSGSMEGFPGGWWCVSYWVSFERLFPENSLGFHGPAMRWRCFRAYHLGDIEQKTWIPRVGHVSWELDDEMPYSSTYVYIYIYIPSFHCIIHNHVLLISQHQILCWHQIIWNQHLVGRLISSLIILFWSADRNFLWPSCISPTDYCFGHLRWPMEQPISPLGPRGIIYHVHSFSPPSNG